MPQNKKSGESNLNKDSLSQGQIEFYRREGYLVLERFFDCGKLDMIDHTIRQITDEAVASGDHSKVLELEPETADGQAVARRIFNPFDLHEEFQMMATDAELLNCVEAIIGSNFSLQHSKVNMKPARVGSAVEWHQDMAYFPHTNDDLITLLIYLDEASVENGCLQVLPRHHTHYFDHALPDGTFAGMITEDLDDGHFGRPVPLDAPAGSVIFMHPVTPHSSLPNRSAQPRRTLIFEYRACDAFPIYYGEMTNIAEAQYRLLRGKPARFARFGGPPPLIPVVGKYQSLYALQSQAKEKMQSNQEQGSGSK